MELSLLYNVEIWELGLHEGTYCCMMAIGILYFHVVVGFAQDRWCYCMMERVRAEKVLLNR